MGFKKATKRKQFLRLLLSAPSGSGKTYSALRIATGLAECVNSRIAVIDTEKGSASLYADKFDFDVLELKEPYEIQDYVNSIKEAENGGYKVLIIDSSTHGWQRILEIVETLTINKYRGNQFRAWGEGTPLYNSWVNAMLNFQGHIIVTARAKTEYIQDNDGKGKSVIRKVGMGTEGRKGLEYEFTIAADGNVEGNWLFSKSRISELQNKIIKYPTEDFGKDLYKWLTVDGVEVIETDPQKLETIKKLMQETNTKEDGLKKYYNIEDFNELENEKADEIIEGLEKKFISQKAKEDKTGIE